MAQLLSCFFVLVVAYNSYQTAKRQGLWSWKEFLIVIAALVTVPILIVLPLIYSPSLHDRPGLATLIAMLLIVLFVCALAYFLRKFFPTNKKAPP